MDRTISCRDCNNDFRFTAGQQNWYERKGFADPVRCASCRKLKKEYRNEIEKAFKENRVAAPPKGIVKCEWCQNPGHQKSNCRLKESATCHDCGKVGRPTSVGFARGLRYNSFEMGCNCATKHLSDYEKRMAKINSWRF